MTGLVWIKAHQGLAWWENRVRPWLTLPVLYPAATGHHLKADYHGPRQVTGPRKLPAAVFLVYGGSCRNTTSRRAQWVTA